MKHQYDSSERTVNLKDWLMELMVRWRVFGRCMIVGLVVGILLCAYKWYKPGYEVVTAEESVDEAIQEATQEEELEPLTENDVEVVDALIEVEKVYRQQLEYNKESTLMQLDATQLPLVELQFYINYVRTDELNDDASNIKAYYSKELESDEYYAYLLQQVEVLSEKAYYKEYLDGSKSFWKKSSGDKAILSYSVCADNLDTAKKIADVTVNYLIGKNEDAEKIFGEHQISLLNYNATICNSFDLIAYQKDKIDTQYSWLTKYNSQKAALSKQQKFFYEFWQDGVSYEEAKSATEKKIIEENNKLTEEGTEESVEETVMLPRKVNVVWIIVGVLGSALVAVAYISLIYLFTGKVRYQDEWNGMYGIPKIANVIMPKEIKGWAEKFDQSLLKKMTKRYGLCDLEAGLGMALAKTLALVKQKKCNKLVVLVTDYTDEKKVFISKLGDELSKRQIEMRVAEDHSLADTVLDDSSEQTVLLVVEHNKEYFYQVEQKIELCELLNCTIQGAIMLIS